MKPIQINVNTSGTEWGGFSHEEIIAAVETAASEYATRTGIPVTINAYTVPQRNTSAAAEKIFNAAWFALTGELS